MGAAQPKERGAPTTVVHSLKGSSVLQQSGTKLAAVATCSVAVQTEDPSYRALSLWDWLTLPTVTSTATHCWMMDARCTRGAPSRGSIAWSCRMCSIIISPPSTSGGTLGSDSHSSTAMLEQMKERLHNIAQDMCILNRSCGEEIVLSSFARAQRGPRRRNDAGRCGRG